MIKLAIYTTTIHIHTFDFESEFESELESEIEFVI